MSKQSGFTIIELIIVCAIIGILSVLVYPVYSNNVLETKLAEAPIALAQMNAKADQWYADNRTYVGFDCNKASFTPANFSCSSTLTASAYSFTLSGINSLNGFSYTLNQAGSQTSSVPSSFVSASTANCTVSGGTASCTCHAIKKNGC